MKASNRFLLAVFLAGICQATVVADWPRWRGPEGNGHVPENRPVPEKLPEEPEVLWRMPVKEGLASPVVAGGKLFYFDARDGMETLHAMHPETREKYWSAAIGETFSDNQGPAGPRNTPLVDEERVYAVSGRGELRCLNVTDGSLIWRVNFVEDFGALFTGETGSTPGAARHGNTGSPLISGEHLFAVAGGPDGAGVVCFDKRTGAVIWKSQNDPAAYPPPVFARVAGMDQIICFTVEGLIGLNKEDGALLWRVPMQTGFGRHVMTPVVIGDLVVAGSHQVGLVGTRISRDENGFKAEQAWLNKEAAVNFSSPVAVGPYIYSVGPQRNFICVEAETGRIRWSQTGYFTSSPDKAHAAMLVMKENILALTDGGLLVMFEANPDECKEISQAHVAGVNWCNPAYANGILFVRDGIRTTGNLMAVELLK
jgi:outer membrane protein assembly factor BamB